MYSQDDVKQRRSHAYFLPRHQQILVHVGAQEACVAVTFHQLVDVVLNGEWREMREDTQVDMFWRRWFDHHKNKWRIGVALTGMWWRLYEVSVSPLSWKMNVLRFYVDDGILNFTLSALWQYWAKSIIFMKLISLPIKLCSTLSML